MQNKLQDLNNHLFAQLERLGDEDLTKENLEIELKRTKAVSTISRNIISNASLMLEARKHIDEYNLKDKDYPEVLGISGGKNEKKT